MVLKSTRIRFGRVQGFRPFNAQSNHRCYLKLAFFTDGLEISATTLYKTWTFPPKKAILLTLNKSVDKLTPKSTTLDF